MLANLRASEGTTLVLVGEWSEVHEFIKLEGSLVKNQIFYLKISFI